MVFIFSYVYLIYFNLFISNLYVNAVSYTCLYDVMGNLFKLKTDIDVDE